MHTRGFNAYSLRTMHADLCGRLARDVAARSLVTWHGLSRWVSRWGYLRGARKHRPQGGPIGARSQAVDMCSDACMAERVARMTSTAGAPAREEACGATQRAVKRLEPACGAKQRAVARLDSRSMLDEASGAKHRW